MFRANEQGLNDRIPDISYILIDQIGYIECQEGVISYISQVLRQLRISADIIIGEDIVLHSEYRRLQWLIWALEAFDDRIPEYSEVQHAAEPFYRGEEERKRP